MSDLPEPLVPPECDLRDFPFMPLDIERLRRSKSWRIIARKKPELGFYMLNLWCAAFHEVPCASLDDDDESLADLAMCSLSRWRTVRSEVLRGWIKCGDGRLYHPVVAEKAREGWERKQNNSARGKRGATARWSQPIENTEAENTTSIPLACNKNAGSNARAMLIDSKGQGQGQGQGEGKEKPSLSGGQKEEEAAHGRVAKRRQQVPADWLPDQAGLEYAHREAGWPQARIDHELARFRDHHRSKGNLFLDLAAAWRTWIRNGAERDKSRHSALPNFATAYADESVEHWRDRLRFWMDEKWGGPTKERWAAGAWGPPPGHAGCRVPREVLAELEAGS